MCDQKKVWGGAVVVEEDEIANDDDDEDELDDRAADDEGRNDGGRFGRNDGNGEWARGFVRLCMQIKFGESEHSVGSRLLYFGGNGGSEHSIGPRLPFPCYKHVECTHTITSPTLAFWPYKC